MLAQSGRFATTVVAGDVALLVLAVAGAALLADFLSDLAHWVFDTWGDTDVPVIGNGIIRGFREHHADPLAITRHDFVEANGATALATIPLLALSFALDPARPGGRLGLAFVIALCAFVVATNQIHLWAHHPRPPRLISALQRAGLVLSPDEHALHHAAPFDRHYCITTGWSNAPLARLGFFAALERGISAATGAIPRRSDPAEPPPRLEPSTSPRTP